jgi:hypothetical protein
MSACVPARNKFQSVILFLVLALGNLVFPPDTVAGMEPLQILGLDSGGYQLIYDPNLNITWYDYAYNASGWQSSMDWAANLNVTFQGASIGGWTLPSALNLDGTGAIGFGSSSEMGYLYCLEFGNAGGPAFNHSPFTDLLPQWYNVPSTGIPPLAAFWTSTLFGDPYGMFAYDFNFANGGLVANQKGELDVPYAVAVHAGLVGVPEPAAGATIIVFVPEPQTCLFGVLLLIPLLLRTRRNVRSNRHV